LHEAVGLLPGVVFIFDNHTDLFSHDGFSVLEPFCGWGANHKTAAGYIGACTFIQGFGGQGKGLSGGPQAVFGGLPSGSLSCDKQNPVDFGRLWPYRDFVVQK
jgi:hypothetical protein